MKKILIIGVAGYAAYWLYKKYTALKDLHLSIQDIRVSEQNLQPVLDVNLLVRNLTAEQLDINAIAGRLSMNGTVVGDIVSNVGQSIPALSDIIVPLRVNLYSSGIATVVKGFLDNFSAPAAMFNFNGTVKVKGVNVPASFNYSLV